MHNKVVLLLVQLAKVVESRHPGSEPFRQTYRRVSYARNDATVGLVVVTPKRLRFKNLMSDGASG